LLLSTTIFQQKGRKQVDTTRNKIGAEFKLTIKLPLILCLCNFPNLKNIGALEVIQSYPIDTVKKDDRYELTRYGLTQFDSGKYS
jgi:hypothetical protein